jgi:hypothetical protein
VALLFGYSAGATGKLPHQAPEVWALFGISAVGAVVCWHLFLLRLAQHFDKPGLRQGVFVQFFALAVLVIVVLPLFLPSRAPNLLPGSGSAGIYPWLVRGAFLAVVLGNAWLMQSLHTHLKREMERG